VNELVKMATLRGELAEIINRVCTQRSRATVMRYGEPVAVVMSLAEAEAIDGELKRLRSLYNIRTRTLPAA
jgi:prevent-host-death family protein